VVWGHYPQFILPAPEIVLERAISATSDGSLLSQAWVTLTEILLGLLAGTSLAFISGYLVAKVNYLEHWLLPILVSLQAIPVLALAPLLVIWFGWGLSSKIIICASTLFFPVFINTILGLRSVDKNLVALMRSLNASFWQKLIFLELPSSLPVFFASLKIGVILSVVGAVVGEFVSANEGLGFLINLAGGLYDTPLRFVAFTTLSLISILLYSLVNTLEKVIIRWQ